MIEIIETIGRDWLGAGDGMVITLLVFICLDLFSDLLADINQKTLSSEKGFKEICEKILILIFTCIGHILDAYVIKTGSVLRTAVILFYLANEGLSIIENASLIGLPIPKKLKDVLTKLHEEAEEGGEEHVQN